MHVSGLFVYPVKSLRGFAVSSAQVDALGIVGDRRFLVVDHDDRFLTQRGLARMAQIATALDATHLTLSADGAGSVRVPLASDPVARVRRVTIWKHEGLLAEDAGAEVTAWLSDFLAMPARLVRIGPSFVRDVKKAAALPNDVVNFADSVPFMAVGEASLNHLNDRLVAAGEEPVPMNRFRPSLVIAGAEPFAEDTWPRVQIGELTMRAAGACARCIVTTTDQLTGERGIEPLRTLATYRRDPVDSTRINFGQNLIHETKRGPIRVGDAIVPLVGSRG
jgi:uncharacterized protein YcbX